MIIGKKLLSKEGQEKWTEHLDKKDTYLYWEKKGGLSNKKVPEELTQKYANKKINGEKTLLLSETKKT